MKLHLLLLFVLSALTLVTGKGHDNHDDHDHGDHDGHDHGDHSEEEIVYVNVTAHINTGAADVLIQKAFAMVVNAAFPDDDGFRDAFPRLECNGMGDVEDGECQCLFGGLSTKLMTCWKPGTDKFVMDPRKRCKNGEVDGVNCICKDGFELTEMSTCIENGILVWEGIQIMPHNGAHKSVVMEVEPENAANVSAVVTKGFGPDGALLALLGKNSTLDVVDVGGSPGDHDGHDHGDHEGDDDHDGHDHGKDGDDHDEHKDGDDHDEHKDGDDHDEHKDGDEHDEHKDGDEHDEHKDGDEHDEHKDGDEHDDHKDKDGDEHDEHKDGDNHDDHDHGKDGDEHDEHKDGDDHHDHDHGKDGDEHDEHKDGDDHGDKEGEDDHDGHDHGDKEGEDDHDGHDHGDKEDDGDHDGHDHDDDDDHDGHDHDDDEDDDPGAGDDTGTDDDDDSPGAGDDTGTNDDDDSQGADDDSGGNENDNPENPIQSDTVCFPGDATVELEDGEHVTMENLRISDRIRVSGNQYSEVFTFGHRDALAVRTHVQLVLEKINVKLELTKSHMLRTHGSNELKTAEEIRVGDSLRLKDGSAVKVVEIREVRKRGLYNPHTLIGDVVVNGVEATSYTAAVRPELADFLLILPKMMYRLTKRDPLFGSLDKSLPTWLYSILQRSVALSN